MNRGTGDSPKRMFIMPLIILLVVVIGCGGSSGPSTEQIQALAEAKQAAVAAEKNAMDLKDEKRALIETLRAKTAELEKIKADKSIAEKQIKAIEEAEEATKKPPVEEGEGGRN